MNSEKNISSVFNMENLNQLRIGIKGAGEMASGIACRLFKSNFQHIFMMEKVHPLAVRRMVSFCEAVHDGHITVEGVTAVNISAAGDIQTTWEENKLPVIVDPGWDTIADIKPHVVIDAIIAKKNLGTQLSDAPLTIGLGPGFEAGKDVHLAIETNRGHNLGRLIHQGSTEPNTGVPGPMKGYTHERVLRAPCDGLFTSDLNIGDRVIEDQVVGHVNDQAVKSQINGILRGQIRHDTMVKNRLKIGDIDPRGEKAYCTTVSEKARAIGGSVLEAILERYNR